MEFSMQRWVGKVAVVTGASSGIGAAITKHLVSAGLKVVGLAYRKDIVEELAKQLADKPGKLYSFAADGGKEQDILDAFKWIKDNVGPVSILVNTAGVIKGTNLIEGGTDLWKETFNINDMAVCLCTKEAVKCMKENNIDGHIILINSVAETLREELNSIGSKIKITSISSGGVQTEIAQAGRAAKSKGVEEYFQHFRILNPEDITDGVIYALSTPPHEQIRELCIRSVGELV